jgi:hypothetical protein
MHVFMAEIPEAALLRDMIYVFQGIEGKLIQLNAERDIFVVDPQVLISLPLDLLSN